MTSGKTPTWKTLDVPTYSYLIPSFGWAKWTAGRPSSHLSYRETMGVVWVESSRERKSRGKRTVPRSTSGVFWNWRGRSKKVGTTFKRWQCWKSKRKNCPSQTFRAPEAGAIVPLWHGKTTLCMFCPKHKAHYHGAETPARSAGLFPWHTCVEWVTEQASHVPLCLFLSVSQTYNRWWLDQNASKVNFFLWQMPKTASELLSSRVGHDNEEGRSHP